MARGQSADLPARPESNAANKQKLAEARRKFNAGKIAEAEKLANECKRPGAKNRLFGDSAEKLLEDIKTCKNQDDAWKKDSSSPGAKRSRSNYLVSRARTLIEEGDFANADRLLTAAEKIQVQRGPGDLKPEQLRQQLALRGGGRQKTSLPVEAQPLASGKKLLTTQEDRTGNVPGDEDSLELPPQGVITADASDSELRKSKVEVAGIEMLDDDPAFGPIQAKGPKSPVKFSRQSSSKTPSDRAQADELLKQAQILLQEGRSDEARIKVQQAEKLDVAYDLLGLTPEYVLTQIELAERDTMLAQKAAAEEESIEPADKSTRIAAETELRRPMRIARRQARREGNDRKRPEPRHRPIL